jgi:hypothetical protein
MVLIINAVDPKLFLGSGAYVTFLSSGSGSYPKYSSSSTQKVLRSFDGLKKFIKLYFNFEFLNLPVILCP